MSIVYDKQIEQLMKIAGMLSKTGFSAETEAIGKFAANQTQSLLLEHAWMRTGYNRAMEDNFKVQRKDCQWIKEIIDDVLSDGALPLEKRVEEAKKRLEAFIY